MTEQRPVIWWLRRDLRLDDNPCLQAALASGGPVIAVAILDDLTASLGAAPLYRLGLGLDAFAKSLDHIGGRLILRRGDPAEVLRALAKDTGAVAIHWSRAYDPDAIARDTTVKTALKDAGLSPESHAGHLLFEPWTVKTKTGGFYKVYSPMWKSVRGIDVAAPQAGPTRWPAPDHWPDSDTLADWDLGARMWRGAGIVGGYQTVGEDAARDRLAEFIEHDIDRYKDRRDIPSVDGTSRLSAQLSLGEIGPRRCWHAAYAAMQDGQQGAEHFLKELVWREFAYHLAYHTPHITTDNWRPEWDAFPWNTDITPEVIAWQRGRTGVPFVDAAMREMYVTGVMHNRARMIVASYLTKHLMTHWRVGLDWFAEHLTDWDPASNALGWQWTAGSGPDAAPYFRVFNPDTQLQKFDPKGVYKSMWIAEGQRDAPQTALDFFEAIPRSWQMSASDRYPDPVVALDVGRRRALSAYENRQTAGASA